MAVRLAGQACIWSNTTEREALHRVNLPAQHVT
jgi:hypothetical protein